MSVSGNTGTAVANFLDDQTGVAQIHVFKDGFEATIHVILIGPVVNSGLAISITSN